MSEDIFELASFKAGKFVHGVARTRDGKLTVDRGKWSAEFTALDMVRQAEREGWGKALRAHAYRLARRDMLDPDEMRRKFKAPQAYMPTDKNWIEAERKLAERYRLAEEWREANPNHRAIRPVGGKGFKLLGKRMTWEASE